MTQDVKKFGENKMDISSKVLSTQATSSIYMVCEDNETTMKRIEQDLSSKFEFVALISHQCVSTGGGSVWWLCEDD